MISIFRKASQIASFATFLHLVSYRVDAHCFHPESGIDHVAVGCDPTISPAPTESPAPSPSPSFVPTDTQAPSHSMLPSYSPTPVPTTSTPSDTPTDAPTESPAPSPSPSDVPTSFPTTSAAPSMSPTDLPSEFPSQNPSFSPTTSSPSESPNGSILLTIVGVKFTIQNVTGEREMSLPNVKYFEKQTTLYLRNQIQQAPGVFKIEVENVLVTDQNFVVHDDGGNFIVDPFLRKGRQLEASQTHLDVTIDVVVSVVLNRSENLKLDVIFEEFFETPEHKNALHSILEQEKSFAQGIFIKGAISSSSASVKKPSNGTAVTGTVLGVLALIVGSGLIWMWIQTRRIAVLQSNNSGKIENIGTISKSFESDDRRVAISSAGYTREIDDGDAQGLKTTKNGESCHSENENETFEYIPTLMHTECNIEVPDTPVTAFAVNGFATPASVNGFMTPVSTKSKVVGDKSVLTIHTLLGGTSPKISLPKSRKKKIPLPPKILGPMKSPFRREKKAGGKVKNQDGQERDAFSVSGVGVVAGENKVWSSEDRLQKATKVEVRYLTQKVSRDLPPLEIGGPDVTPFEAKSAVIPVEESVVSRPHTGRQNKKQSRAPRPCPPLVIGGPPDTSLSTAKSTKTKDLGVVDIVDEIAYLYSTKSEPERYKDDFLNY